MSREQHNGSRTGAARALGALTRLLVAAAGGSNRTRPPICEAEYRSAEPAAGLHETRGTREPRGQQRRVDRHEVRDMDMAGKMSEIDRQGGCGRENARKRRNATGARCSTWARRLAASLFVFTMLGTALPAAAQSPIIFTSNTGQATDSPSNTVQAQPFTTGNRSAGYTLTSVGVGIGILTTGTDTIVRIVPNASSGVPDLSDPTRFIVLSSPTLVANRVNTFTAPSNTTLAANTTYHAYVSTAADEIPDNLQRTRSKAEDSGGASGWSIGDTRYWKSSSGLLQASTQYLLKIRINGHANIAPKLANAIADQTIIAGAPVNLTLPANTFSDADGDALTYTATQSDGEGAGARRHRCERTRDEREVRCDVGGHEKLAHR